MQKLYLFRRSFIKTLIIVPLRGTATALVLVRGTLSDQTLLRVPRSVIKCYLGLGVEPPADFDVILLYMGNDPYTFVGETKPATRIQMPDGKRASIWIISQRDEKWCGIEFLQKYTTWIWDLSEKISKGQYSCDGSEEWQQYQREFAQYAPDDVFLCANQDVMLRDMIDIYYSLLDSGEIDEPHHFEPYVEYRLNPYDY